MSGRALAVTAARALATVTIPATATQTTSTPDEADPPPDGLASSPGSILGLEDLVDYELISDRGRIVDVLDLFQLQHISTRRSAWYTPLEDTRPKAEAEGKRPLVVYRASGRPDEVAGFELTEPWTLRGP